MTPQLVDLLLRLSRSTNRLTPLLRRISHRISRRYPFHQHLSNHLKSQSHTFRRITQPLRNARHCIAQSFTRASYDIASRVGNTGHALADSVACCAEGVTEAACCGTEEAW
jgi:hypothetical protein